MNLKRCNVYIRLNPAYQAPHDLHLPPLAIFMAHFLQYNAQPHESVLYAISPFLHTIQVLLGCSAYNGY